MKVDLFATSGEIKGSIELPEEIFAAKINKALLWEAVRGYLSNQRQGTAKTKTRGEVRGGGKKPWAQKHTGRARHGSIRSPIWVGGGVVFGPRPRDYYIQLPKEKKRQALLAALSARFSDLAIQFIEDIKISEPKTKLVADILKKFIDGGSTLLVVPEMEKNLKLASRNIPNLSLLTYKDLNAYSVLVHNKIIFTQSAVNQLKEFLLANK